MMAIVRKRYELGFKQEGIRLVERWRDAIGS